MRFDPIRVVLALLVVLPQLRLVLSFSLVWTSASPLLVSSLLFKTTFSHPLIAWRFLLLTRYLVSGCKFASNVQILRKFDPLRVNQVVGVGAVNGCTDVGGIVDTATLDGITVNVDAANGLFTASGSIAGKLSPGDRIRIDGSSQVRQTGSPSV